MFGLKPNEMYPECFSDRKTVLKRKKGYWTITEHYKAYKGCPHYLTFDYWEYSKKKTEGATWKKKFNMPLDLRAVYVLYIYHHLGICHKDLRSKFYIGKAREKR